MDFLQRQLRFRNYNLGPFAIVVASIYLFTVAFTIVLMFYYLLDPDPNAIGATFEGLPAIVVTAPTSLFLSAVTGPLTYVLPGTGVLTLVVSGLVQAFVIYVVLRGRRRVVSDAAAS